MTLKIAFYLPHLNTGGAEMVFVRLAEGLAARGHDTRFVLDRREGALLAKVTRPVEVLDAARTITAVPRLARWLAQARPDVLMSALSPNNLAAIVARRLAYTPTAVIVGEHSLLRMQLDKNWKFRMLPPLIRRLYPQADAIVAVSEAGRRDVAAVMGVDPMRVEVLPNPAVDDDTQTRAAAPVTHPWLAGPRVTPVLLAAGRLTGLKNFPLLIEAFADLRQERQARLILLGDGPDRALLMAQVQRLGLTDSVDLPGAVANPLPWFARAAALVCTSIYEGFGLVLVEAMACGTPVITTEAGGPPAELVAGVGVVIANGDRPALTAAMRQALDHPPERARLEKRAERYTTNAAVLAYQSLITRVLAAR